MKASGASGNCAFSKFDYRTVTVGLDVLQTSRIAANRFRPPAFSDLRYDESKVTPTRREWLRAAALCAACRTLVAARKDFWQTKDPATWTSDEKDAILWQSPWARDGFARMEENKHPPPSGQRVELPNTTPGQPPGGMQSYPIGEPIPRAQKGGAEPVQFHVLARWETAAPVRRAGGPETPELTGQFYVIRLHGLPLMPPPKTKPGEAAPPDPNVGIVQSIKEGSYLERAGKPALRCAHIFTGSGSTATDVLLFFPRDVDPISLADKMVTLESRFAVFHVEIKFPLKDMLYKGELAL